MKCQNFYILLQVFGLLVLLGGANSVIANNINKLEYTPKLSLATAEMIADTCIDKQAAARSSTVAVAVFDSGGFLVTFKRMENVSPGAVGSALSKGKSAASWGYSTRDMAAWIAGYPGATVLPDLLGVPGGLPIKTQLGTVIGGVGVSGAPADEDEACAAAGLRAVEQYLIEKEN